MKELKDMSEIEIKALSYDQIAQIEQCKDNLKVLNQELVNRAKVVPEVTPEVIKEKTTR